MESITNETYEARLKDIISQRFGSLPPFDREDLCSILMGLTKVVHSNYIQTPDDLVSVFMSYVGTVRVSVEDILRNPSRMMYYFKDYEPPVLRENERPEENASPRSNPERKRDKPPTMEDIIREFCEDSKIPCPRLDNKSHSELCSIYHKLRYENR